MHGGLAHISCRLNLTIGEMIGIEQAKRFRDASLKIASVRLERLHAAYVDIPQIHRCIASFHPFSKDHAGATSRLDAHRVKPGSNKEIHQFGCFTKNIPVIRRKALRAIEKGLDACVSKNRHPLHRAFKYRFEMIEILRQ